jgi:hypothetical protein
MIRLLLFIVLVNKIESLNAQTELDSFALANSISKAKLYLVKNQKTEPSYIVLFEEYLNQKYNANIYIDSSYHREVLKDENAYYLQALTKDNLNAVRAKIIVDSLLIANDTLSAIVLLSVNSKRIEDLNRYKRIIFKVAKSNNNYDITHAFFAINMIVERIPAFCNRKTKNVLMHLINEQKRIVKTEKDNTDLWVETIAFLGTFDSTFKVREYVSEIIKSQHADGGWQDRIDGDATGTHTTFLALWALLESMKER